MLVTDTMSDGSLKQVFGNVWLIIDLEHRSQFYFVTFSPNYSQLFSKYDFSWL